MAIRASLFAEVIAMAFDTVRSNKMRSGLTVLGVVIGITSIVGMTAMIRGFDQSLRDMLGSIGPNTIFVQRFGIGSFSGGAELRQLLKRPNLSISDARALEEQATTLQYVDVELGAGVGPTTMRRVFYRDLKTKNLVVLGTSEFFAEGTRIPMLAGRFFNGSDLQYRRNVVVLGNTAYKLLFEPTRTEPIGKLVRVGNTRFEIVGVFDKRPTPGGFDVGADDFLVVPYTTYQREYGLRAFSIGRGLGTIMNIQISVLPREGVNQKEALADVQRVMRIRHGLKLEEPDDFDLLTRTRFSSSTIRSARPRSSRCWSSPRSR
jgi:putative ABC transport system permease protein